MAQYIDKSALVAEIEKWLKEIDKGFPNDHNLGRMDAYVRTVSFINTLEVKEVDLQSEIDRVWDNTSDAFLEDGWKEFEDIAKHFFKFGLKAQKGE